MNPERIQGNVYPCETNFFGCSAALPLCLQRKKFTVYHEIEEQETNELP
jgi:hypothetical protein